MGLGPQQRPRENKIAQACNLAIRISEVAITLEWLLAGRYDVAFNEFVQASETLYSLDAPIRFSNKRQL